MIAFRIHRGFTLIEVLIAVLVLAIGLLGIGAVFPVVVRQQRQAQDTIQGLIARKNAEGYLLARLQEADKPLKIKEIAKVSSVIKTTVVSDHYLNNSDSVVFQIINGLDKDHEGLLLRKEKLKEILDGREFAVDFRPDSRAFTIAIGAPEDELGLSILNPEPSKNDNWTVRRTGQTLARNIAAFIAANVSQSDREQKWFVPKTDPKSGLITIDQSKISLSERLSPSPFSSEGEPQFVWDIAARLIGSADQKDADDQKKKPPSPGSLGTLELAVFVRRIDTGITLGQPSGKKYTLSHVLAGDGIPANYRRVPVGVDSTGRPTLNGTPNYATLQVVDVEQREQGTKLQFPKGMQPGLLAALRQPGQKFVDNTGLVYTVAKADDLDRSTVVLEQPVPPDVIERVENDGLQLRVLVSPQVPAAITVVKVSL